MLERFLFLLCSFPFAVEQGTEGVVKVNQRVYFLSNPTKSASKPGRDFWEDGRFPLYGGTGGTEKSMQINRTLSLGVLSVVNSHFWLSYVSLMVSVLPENLQSSKCRLRFIRAGFRSCQLLRL